MSFLPITVEDWQAFRKGFLCGGGFALLICFFVGSAAGIIALAVWLNNPIPLFVLIPLLVGLISGTVSFLDHRAKN